MFTYLQVLEANTLVVYHYVSDFKRKRKERESKEYVFSHWEKISGVEHVSFRLCYRRKTKLSAECRYQFPVYFGILSYCREVSLVAELDLNSARENKIGL